MKSLENIFLFLLAFLVSFFVLSTVLIIKKEFKDLECKEVCKSISSEGVYYDEKCWCIVDKKPVQWESLLSPMK